MAYNCTSPEDVQRTIKDDKIEMIDLRFTDLPGLWQHFSVPGVYPPMAASRSQNLVLPIRAESTVFALPVSSSIRA
jgi:glutamine synthetase